MDDFQRERQGPFLPFACLLERESVKRSITESRRTNVPEHFYSVSRGFAPHRQLHIIHTYMTDHQRKNKL
ncbi:hypothetical protein [Paraburkholderia phenoliruptrix]|uniref:Uncharacterized protein n=1 Tax=Paraburkholderia phenoliruptrix TaxID=252970 RepID=A0ABV3WJ79_9BURK